jgi:hypothetical protein
MNNERKLILRVNFNLTTQLYGILFLLGLSLFIIIKTTDIDSSIYVITGGVVLCYLEAQTVCVAFELYNDSFVILHPLRPFLRFNTLDINSIKQITIYDNTFGNVPAAIVIFFIDNKNKEHKKKFFFDMNRNEFQKLIDAMRELKLIVNVESKYLY